MDQEVKVETADALEEDDRRGGDDRRSGETRRVQRRRIIKGVRVSFGNDFCSVDGVLKNVSETGALLQLKDGQIVPDVFVIHNDLDGYKVDCEVIRREGTRLGISFTSEKTPIAAKRTQVVNFVASSRQSEDFQDEEDGGVTNEQMAKIKPVFGKRGRA